MKKNIMLSLLALVLVLGISGTLIHSKGKSISAKEKANVKTEKAVVVAMDPSATDTSPPIIEGQKDWEVYQGEEIDVLTGVTAKDHSNKHVKLTASAFSTDNIGDQKVVLTAEDSSYNKISKTITVHVKAPEVAEPVSSAQETAEPAPQETVEPFYEEVAQEKNPAQEPVQAPVAVATQPTWAPYTMYVGGIAISYQNAGQGSGQSVIDSNSNVIATWGGAVIQSGNDGANTHFIGHNPGIFSILFSLGGGSEIIVTDGTGTPTSYYVNQIVQVDDYATRVDNGQSFVEEIVGTGGGERITLQTCINDDINLIVMASAA